MRTATDIPGEFLCPITHEVMRDPVVALDGHSYERAAIQQWFAIKLTSPMTNQPLANALIPNHALRNTIQQFLAKPPVTHNVTQSTAIQTPTPTVVSSSSPPAQTIGASNSNQSSQSSTDRQDTADDDEIRHALRSSPETRAIPSSRYICPTDYISDFAENSFGWFKDSMRQQDRLRLAAKKGDIKDINYCLTTLRVSINCRGTRLSLCSITQGLYDRTPLILASRYGHLDAVRSLIENEADLNRDDTYGYTALDYAVSAKYLPIAKVLSEAGAILSRESQEKLDELLRTDCGSLTGFTHE